MKRKSFFTILISVSMLLTGPASAFATENTEVFFVDEYGGGEKTEVFLGEENAAEVYKKALAEGLGESDWGATAEIIRKKKSGGRARHGD